MRRRLARPPAGIAVIVVLAVVIVGGGYVYLRQSLPVVDGTIAVPGLSAPVQVIRDRDDIPHIFAATKADAFFGLGYVHAQDRLWQMEFQRRIGFGRLSEIFGSATLPDDRFLRTVGFGRAARAAWEHLEPDARRQIEAYIDGVNAFIGSHDGRQLPPEFSLLRFEPEPWSGPDVLVWAKMMAWDLSENYRFEMMRHDLASKVGVDRMRELLPPYPVDGLNILSDQQVEQDLANSASEKVSAGETAGLSALSANSRSPVSLWSAGLASLSDFLAGNRIESLGSNNWVVDGTLTASGKPLLANDPHLATHIPSLWYLAHMSAGDFEVIGATLPGVPAVAIGRNRFIAWGETNAAADVEDLYREHIDDAAGTAEFRGAQEPMRVVRETIRVKGQAPVAVDVRITRHGPLISDAINANASLNPSNRPPALEPLAFRWTSLDDEDQTATAFLRINEAHDWREFTEALQLFAGPSQNFVYADTSGHIGYYAPGRIPIRASGDGTIAAEGWSGMAEWIGWIPFEKLPHAFDPPEHFIVTANNRPVPTRYPYFIADEYPEPYRAQRITDLLRGRTKLTPDDFRAIQADTLSLQAKALLPLLLAHAHPTDPIDRQAIGVLSGWNDEAGADSPAAAIFESWFLRLEPSILEDELGADTNKAYDGRFSYITRFVAKLLTNPAATSSTDWCDDIRTPTHETCDDDVTRALHEGVALLARSLGSDMSRWRWDGVHRTIFPHQGLDAVPVLRPLLSRSMPNGGDWSTVDVGAVDVDHPFNQIAIPGYRQIVDLSPANDSRFIDAVGESGHFLSKHYDDFLQDWHDVRHRAMRMERTDIENGALGHLTLVPTAVIKN